MPVNPDLSKPHVALIIAIIEQRECYMRGDKEAWKKSDATRAMNYVLDSLCLPDHVAYARLQILFERLNMERDALRREWNEGLAVYIKACE
jgi:hypothetical protein